jgi:hypothetical protein
MMEICDSGHDEIVFDTRWCPLCQAYEEMHELEERCERLEAEKDKLEETIDDLKPLVPEYFI